MNSNSSFSPNWVSVPGETISDILAVKNMSVDDFANELEADTVYVRELIAGQITINEELANKLCKSLGSSTQFWLNREYYYRSRITELEKEWINRLPVKDMIRLGWIKKGENIVEACLNFFSANSYLDWKHKYSASLNITAFRKSMQLESNFYSIASWLRQGEIESERVDCSIWNPALLNERLSEIRSLAKIKNPLDFIPKLKAIFAECGVSLIILRTPNGCPASGATKFISDSKAMILLSFRFLSDDQFWFTVFHEIGHLILHGEKKLFIEGSNSSDVEEIEANEFAQNVLIPSEYQHRLRTMPANQIEIKKLARDADISLGIVVGQLQYLKRLNIKFLNGFKRRYDIDDVLAASP